MKETPNKIVRLDRRPYRPPRRASVVRDAEAFGAFMVRLWRRALIALSVFAIVSLAGVLGILIWLGKGGIGEALAAVLATCFLLGFAYSGFAFFTRRPPTFVHHHHHRHDPWRERDHG